MPAAVRPQPIADCRGAPPARPKARRRAAAGAGAAEVWLAAPQLGLRRPGVPLAAAPVGDVQTDARPRRCNAPCVVPQRLDVQPQLPVVPGVLQVAGLAAQGGHVGGERRKAVVPVAEELVDRQPVGFAGAQTQRRQARARGCGRPAARDRWSRGWRATCPAERAARPADRCPARSGRRILCVRRSCLSQSPPTPFSADPAGAQFVENLMLARSQGPANRR